MRDFVIPVAIGLIVAFGWIFVWTIVVRAIEPKGKLLSQESRLIARQCAREMGMFRYVLIYGVMGQGFAIGLGLAIALEAVRHPISWFRFGFLFTLVGLGNGLFSRHQFVEKALP